MPEHTTVAPIPNELPEILAAIRNRAALRDGASQRLVFKNRAAQEIAACLGPRAAACVLQGVTADCRNLLTEVQPVLCLFLGKRAAGRLTTRVIDGSIVRS